MRFAVIAGIAVRYLFTAHKNLFHTVSRFESSAHEFIAEHIGVAAPAGTAGQNQDILGHAMPPV